jgi:putative acetyltransferase
LLRYPSLEDAPALLAAVTDPAFPRDSAWGRASTMAELRALLSRRQASHRDGSQLSWTVVAADDARAIGLLNLSRQPEPRTWILGFWLAPACWGRGYAVEASRCVLAHAFEEQRQDCVWAGSALWNLRSQRVLEKLGFSFQGENPDGYRDAGEPVRTREYRMLRADWTRLAAGAPRAAR